MGKHRGYYFALGTIIFLGILTRVIFLGRIPLGYTFDEAGIAYDAWSVATWHRDQYGSLMPLSFRSFGDYKPPVMIYLTALIYLISGPELIVVRIISAIAGIASIVVCYLIAGELFPKSRFASLFTALAVSISPWSLHLSRIGFEQNLAFLVGVSGLLLLLTGRTRPWMWLLAGLALGLDTYTFHTAKIFAPLALISFGYVYRDDIKKYRQWFLGGVAVFVMSVLPLAIDSVWGNSGARAETLIGSVNELLINISRYFSFRFWTMGWDGVSQRHAVPGFGVILWPMYVVLWGTILFLGVKRQLKLMVWPLLLCLFGLIPGIIAEGSPHVIRSQFSLMGAAVIIGYGFDKIMKHRRIFISTLIVTMTVFFTYMWQYLNDYPAKTAMNFQYGYQEVIALTDSQSADKIVMTDSYGQPYIYVLFYKKIQAQRFLWGGLNRYEFRKINWPETTTGVYAGTPNEIPVNDPAVIDTVLIPNTNQVAWVIAKI